MYSIFMISNIKAVILLTVSYKKYKALVILTSIFEPFLGPAMAQAVN